MKKTNKKPKISILIIALIAVLFGGVLFVGAVSGWFDNAKVVLDPEYYSKDATFLELTTEEYEKLIQEKKSFIVFIDQTGCTTADKLREFINKEMSKRGIVVYHMMFRDLKETSLYNQIKYYPSVAIIKKGKVKTFLSADSDEDADRYNNYDAFAAWFDQNIAAVENF